MSDYQWVIYLFGAIGVCFLIGTIAVALMIMARVNVFMEALSKELEKYER